MLRGVPSKLVLNQVNGLTVHTVSPSIAPEIVAESLQLTERLFPREKTARTTLSKVYQALMAGETRIDDFEVFSFFIYTMKDDGRERVVGGSGLYRLLDRGPEADATLGKALPMMEATSVGSGATLTGERMEKRLDIVALLWGGRLFVDQSAARSPAVMPFLMRHIFSAARTTIERFSMAPYLFAYTEVADNDGVRGFYQKLGFVQTPATFTAAGNLQQVFVLHFPQNAEVLERLNRMVLRYQRQVAES